MTSFFIFLNKPRGWTSQKCLTVFKKKFGFKKVGHHGTLDPFATGLLLAGVGEATKFFRFLDDSQKTYFAKLLFGEETDTLDNTGKMTVKKTVPHLSRDEIFAKIKPLLGNIEQIPPMYSAIKVNGERLYRLARKGQDVERKPRPVTIFDLQIKEWEPPVLTFETTVSRGAYIRSLAKQIAEHLGTVGHLIELTRTKLLGYSLDLETHLAFDLEKEVQNLEGFQIEIPKLLCHLPVKECSLEEAKSLLCGKPVEETVEKCRDPRGDPRWYYSVVSPTENTKRVRTTMGDIFQQSLETYPDLRGDIFQWVVLQYKGHFLGIAKKTGKNLYQAERMLSLSL